MQSKGLLDDYAFPSPDLKIPIAGRLWSEKLLRRTIKMIREKAKAQGVSELNISASDCEILDHVLKYHPKSEIKIGEGVAAHLYSYPTNKFIIRQLTGVRAAWNVGTTVTTMFRLHSESTKQPQTKTTTTADDSQRIKRLKSDNEQQQDNHIEDNNEDSV